MDVSSPGRPARLGGPGSPSEAASGWGPTGLFNTDVYLTRK